MELFTKDNWLQLRDDYMRAARDCLDTLTNRESYWAYTRDDERTRQAVGNWVARAKVAHDIALGRRPVISKAVGINNSEGYTGPIYAA